MLTSVLLFIAGIGLGASLFWLYQKKHSGQASLEKNCLTSNKHISNTAESKLSLCASCQHA